MVERVAIIGGGPAGLMAAAMLAPEIPVDLYERQRTIARKLLVAGHGGLNLTNDSYGEAHLSHYTPRDRLRSIIGAFGPAELRAWFSSLGVETYVGSSGRIFPRRGIRPAHVVQRMRSHLLERGVGIYTDHAFVGFDQQARPVIENAGRRITLDHACCLFALGGASWPVTGSKGDWLDHFAAIGVATLPFAPSNCGVEVTLPEALRIHAGKPLKNIRASAGQHAIRGELTITAQGLEGNAIYPLVPALRGALQDGRSAELYIDLKPDLSVEALGERLRSTQWKERPAALRLDRTAMAFFKAFTPRERYLDGNCWVTDLKAVRVPVTGLRSIEEAISTVGGIALPEVAPDLSLLRFPHLFVAGEMLDTDAPTGGFLLQGAFAMGYRAAMGIRARLPRGLPH
jgi:uncharacterized flavoprotein (TIGR03862 family)